MSSLENGSTKHTKFHWLGGSTINTQAHVAFKVWRKVATPSMHKLTSLSKFGGRTTSTCRPAWRSTSTCTGWALPTLEKGEWVYLSRTNYIEWISFTRLMWTRSEAAETARPHTSNIHHRIPIQLNYHTQRIWVPLHHPVLHSSHCMWALSYAQ